jgi:ankyrin repeat protein
MHFIYNQYLRLLLLILLLNIPGCLFSQVIVLDTTMTLSNPLTASEQLDLNNYLIVASSSGSLIAIDWLLRNGAEVDSKTAEGATPLMLAVANDKTDAVKILLKYNPDVNIKTDYSETPLLAAVKNGNLDIAEALLRDSADIDLADKDGVTALHYASINGYFYIADMLLYYNATNDIKSLDGTTPLMSAIWAGYTGIADLLIQNGANYEEKDNQGFTPLMIACQNGDTTIISILLKKRVNLYQINNFNYDALDISIRSNQGVATDYLLRSGYKWEKRLPNTINPFSVAVRFNRSDIMKILKKYQAPENHPFGFDRVTISASAKLTTHDYFTGVSFAIREPHVNGGLIVGLDFKPGYTRVLMKVDDHTYYQYQDKSAMVSGGIFKDFDLTDNVYSGNWIITASASAAYGLSNKLVGTNITPWNRFIFVPSVGIKRTGNRFSIYGNLDYMKSDFYKIGPLWVRIGIAYTLFFDNDRAPLKNIRWY